MDAFKDRLSQKAKDTTRPELAHQSRGRGLSEAEQKLASELMDIMSAPQHDYTEIAAELARRGVEAPQSRRTDWTKELLESELQSLNSDLDRNYAENGYGA